MTSDLAISASGLPSLAFLVNESRSRVPHLSRDYVARYWVPPQFLKSVAEHWDKYSIDVYPDDDKVVGIRNHFFLEQIRYGCQSPSTLINVGAGLTSYPYSLPSSNQFIEIDLPPLITFKAGRRAKLEEANELPIVKVTEIAADVTSMPPKWLESAVEKVLPENKKIFLLEGLSYYLSPHDWNRLISELRDSTKPNDLLMFDYWDITDGENKILGRFKLFCQKEFGIDVGAFNLLSQSDIEEYVGFHVMQFSDVFEQDCRYLAGTLERHASSVIPERYAILRRV